MTLSTDPTLVGAASALGGVIVGALAESLRARLAFRREKGWELEEDRKKHLEEIYEVLERFRETYSLMYAEALRIAATQTAGTLSQAMKPVPWARLRMLVFLYLPELRAHLDDIELTGPKLGTAAADAIMHSSANAARNMQLVSALDTALNDLTKAVDAMRDRIVDLSRAVAIVKAASVGRNQVSSHSGLTSA